MSERKVDESRVEDYNYENIAKIMSEEEYGMHISLIDTGDVKKGSPVFGIKVETDLDLETIENIMMGLLGQIQKGRQELE